MEELKPCPFCGNKATLREYQDESLWNHNMVPYFQVLCHGCDLEGPSFCDDKEECLDHWNTRPGEDAAKLEESNHAHK